MTTKEAGTPAAAKPSFRARIDRNTSKVGLPVPVSGLARLSIRGVWRKFEEEGPDPQGSTQMKVNGRKNDARGEPGATSRRKGTSGALPAAPRAPGRPGMSRTDGSLVPTMVGLLELCP